MRYRFLSPALFIAFSGFTASCLAAPLIDFESLSDGEFVTTQFPGVVFSHAQVLTAGISLNELELPPRSGTNVALDAGGPMILDFSPGVNTFEGYFTYSRHITLTAFSHSGAVLNSVISTFNSNLAVSGDPGSMPNEKLSFAEREAIQLIVIQGDPAGQSFVADDISFTVVPEPDAAVLVSQGFAALVVLTFTRTRLLQRKASRPSDFR
jgi:hypothetical protein